MRQNYTLNNAITITKNIDIIKYIVEELKSGNLTNNSIILENTFYVDLKIGDILDLINILKNHPEYKKQ